MQKILLTAGMLAISNVFMTFAWYGHLKNFNSKPWIVAAIISWGIALFEYIIQVPANRLGHQVMNLGQLKILQEAITLSVFVPFAIVYMKEGLKQEYLWASIFILAAVFCIFKGGLIR
ncbi:MAG: DMT family protein [Candidatus Omnitrophica bacterium]|nr:DMT family protein [Candidatus Omnitrophota bacterium]